MCTDSLSPHIGKQARWPFFEASEMINLPLQNFSSYLSALTLVSVPEMCWQTRRSLEAFRWVHSPASTSWTRLMDADLSVSIWHFSIHKFKLYFRPYRLYLWFGSKHTSFISHGNHTANMCTCHTKSWKNMAARLLNENFFSVLPHSPRCLLRWLCHTPYFCGSTITTAARPLPKTGSGKQIDLTSHY